MQASSDDEGVDYLSDDHSSSGSDTSPPRPAGPPLPQNFFAPPFYGRPPDASDDEHPHSPPPIVPSAAPRVPTYEYYGFVLYLLSSLAFLVYLLWAYLPSPFLHGLGIYYYPDRWWALATPAFLVMALCYVYVALASYNREVLTLELRRVETVVDDAGQVARGGGKEAWSRGTDAVLDIPLAGVCEVLYGEGREGEEDEDDLWTTTI
ncbi:subunit P of phosphatidylinositol N-acetylglucosaminyltransferase [Cordyceps fumosorosea ARSEF 2679]|uniref:Subunit P of phosphatidylinositol N-acetylglucosaminyltransferase n=1 Tax=Cordyceps fumosorosea (strain ARSEF 2679) TaxID=1081104 RepID=A0A167J2B7_CORFA|nr:subunit P of phosphatidylinositol N-acetylglucosaminyltransferase [Cordyceps fumosorosea ARSEF 2679]OAA49715.1 subunit P of phosphatidylinositol N-acetylglucosaminyltransferase [Cordyceps fumosorosea ARSEF 2679]